MTNVELVEYYKNLLILQYKKQAKAPAHIQALIENGMIFELIESVKDGFNIDTSIGIQQDILAKYLGIDRVVSGIPFYLDYFGFMKYFQDPATSLYVGFMKYGETPPDAEFFKYGGSQDVLTLTDLEFRDVMKFRVIQANSLSSLGEIDRILYEFFGTNVYITDNFDMNITYNFLLSQRKLALILQSEDLLSRPMGVELHINFV